jgi:arylsulfatase A-like enzyme
MTEDLLFTAGNATLFSSRLFLGTKRLRITGGYVDGSSTGITADGNATDIKGGLIIEGGSVEVGFLEDVICGISGDGELILRYADPLRDAFVELASPDCSLRFVGMSQANARTIIDLRCSIYGLEPIEGSNYRLVTDGSDTVLEPYAWVWTGDGDGISLYQGANWDTDLDSAGTQAGSSFSSDKKLPANLLITSGNVGGGGFGTDLNLYRYGIYMTGGIMNGNSSGGIVGGVNARNDRNPIHLSGGTIDVEWLSALELHLSGTGKLILRDADEALDNVVIVLNGTDASIEFEAAEYMQVIQNYLPMIDTDAGPAEAGLNVCISPLSGGGYRLKRILDVDGDNMDDTWESDWTGSTAATGTEDTDMDNLNLLSEFVSGTRPDWADTDDDGLNDGAETSSNPLLYDTDGDGLSDSEETTTNPLLADTDGDGFKDGGEIRRGTDPLDDSDRPEAPNIIFILVDDAGWGELGIYGNPVVQTPALDTMATEGQRYTAAYTNGCVCAPTRYSVMVGRHTGRAELRSWNVRMRTGDTSLATIMRDAGYQTSIFGKWAIGDAGNGGLPNQNGFDHFYGIVDHQEGHRHYHRYLWRNDTRVFYNPYTAFEHGASAVDVAGAGNIGTMSGDLEANRGNAHSHDLITKELFSWITDHKDDTFFASWHPIHPHGPTQESAHPDDLIDGDGILADTAQRSMIDYHYSASGLTDTQQIRASQMSSIDYDVGRLIALLTDLGIEDNTIIIFTSDNGADQKWAEDAALQMVGDLRGWKFNLYEGGIRVPFIVWGNGVQTGVSDEPVSLDDIMPTIAEIGQGCTNTVTSGRSILSLIDGSTAALDPKPLYWEWSSGGNWTRAVRLGDWKLHRSRSTSTPVTTTYELYNLATDLQETTDVSTANTAVVDQLERIMDDPYFHDIGFENFRATDEFQTIDGDGKVALGNVGSILDDGMTAWNSLAYDLASSARFEVRFVLDATEAGAFELTDETGTTFVGFTVDRNTNQFTLTSGATSTTGTLPAADSDGTWTAWLDWAPSGSCTVSIGNVELGSAAPVALSHLTRARLRSISGTVEFSSFKLYAMDSTVEKNLSTSYSETGFNFRHTRLTQPGATWQYQYSDNLAPVNWTTAEILRENRQLNYGSVESVEVVFPIKESTEPNPPANRFYRSVLVTP